jgi:hypothetical protein
MAAEALTKCCKKFKVLFASLSKTRGIKVWYKPKEQAVIDRVDMAPPNGR